MWEIRKIVSKGEYDYAVVPEHPNATKHNYVLHHRVVMENEIGRLLNEEEVVHHIDGNKKNNDIENLELHSRKGHAELHGKEKKTKYVLLKCPECQNEFERERPQTHLCKNTENTFCSRSCNGKFLFRDEEEKEKRKQENVIEQYRK